jgi:serine/threonine-protein kinase
MSSAAPTPGTLLAGKYLVERVLGEGGMGVVVAARHTQLEQRVALKFVLPEALKNRDAVERFAREARAAAKLKSEHVARVLDVGALENGAPYMVMEYLEGRDLGAIIEERPLEPRHAVDLVLQACEAVAEAHAAGIVHRDLKPQNLFVTTRVDGRALVKVLDFGISKQSNPDGSASGLSLTRTAMVMGSPNYMSPEALRSAKQVDARADLWALGVILYEAMTGSVPFVADTITQLTAMVLEQHPRPLSELRPDVPEGLARAVGACLEKDLSRRMPTVADLARALEPFGSATGVAERIAAVARGGSTLRSADRSSDRVAAMSASGSTSVAWGETILARGSRVRAVAIALGVTAVALLVAGGAFALLFHRASRPAAAASSLSAPDVPVAPSAGAAAAHPSEPALPAAAQDAPDAALNAAPLPSPAPSIAAPVHHRPSSPPGPRPPPSRPASDELPSERK